VRPPFQITPAVLGLCSEVERLLGRAEGSGGNVPTPRLRRANRIRTVGATVAIERNALSTAQITAIIDHKRVIGPRKDVLEAIQANEAYDAAPSLKPFSTRDLLRAPADDDGSGG
jgi:Fic family protein